MGSEPELFPETLKVRKDLADAFFHDIGSRGLLVQDVVRDVIEKSEYFAVLRKLANGMSPTHEYSKVHVNLYVPNWVTLGRLTREFWKLREDKLLSFIFEMHCQRR